MLDRPDLVKADQLPGDRGQIPRDRRVRPRDENRLALVDGFDKIATGAPDRAQQRPSNVSDRATWPELNGWFVDTITKMRAVFLPILNEVNATPPAEADEEAGPDAE